MNAPAVDAPLLAAIAGRLARAVMQDMRRSVKQQHGPDGRGEGLIFWSGDQECSIMIVSVANLPDSARQPLLLALRYQALAVATKALSQTAPIGREHGEMAKEFSDIILLARSADVVQPFTKTTVEENLKGVEEASSLLWTIGLAHLQKAILEGRWIPAELDLSVKPKDDPILKHKGTGFTSGLRPA